jgi:hypothetical protein
VFQKFKTSAQVIILGEQHIPNYWEGMYVEITTIYNEICLLKNNNDVVDLSKSTILDKLYFDDYVKDLSIVQNALFNVGVGSSGQGWTCRVFNAPMLFFNVNEPAFGPLHASVQEFAHQLNVLNERCG